MSRRAIAATAAAATAIVALGALGCGPSDAGREDAVARVYLGTAPGAIGDDAADGAALALSDAGDAAGGIDIELVAPQRGAKPGASPYAESVAAAARARRASEDTSAIAFLGDLDSAATRFSLPIANQAGMLQVSPSATAPDLTGERGADEGLALQPPGEETFGRVAPSDLVQADAAAALAARDGLETVTVIEDGSRYGRTIGERFESATSGAGIELVDAEAQRPDGYFIAAEDMPREPSSTARGPELIGTDALFDDVESGRLGGPRIRLTSSLLPVAELPGGAGFARAFEGEFGRPPTPEAAYSYEAMAVILDSIDRAADPASRPDVVDAFFATSDRDSILGTYTIDTDGNTSLDEIAVYGVEEGSLQPLETIDGG